MVYQRLQPYIWSHILSLFSQENHYPRFCGTWTTSYWTTPTNRLTKAPWKMDSPSGSCNASTPWAKWDAWLPITTSPSLSKAPWPWKCCVSPFGMSHLTRNKLLCFQLPHKGLRFKGLCNHSPQAGNTSSPARFGDQIRRPRLNGLGGSALNMVLGQSKHTTTAMRTTATWRSASPNTFHVQAITTTLWSVAVPTKSCCQEAPKSSKIIIKWKYFVSVEEWACVRVSFSRDYTMYAFYITFVYKKHS